MEKLNGVYKKVSKLPRFARTYINSLSDIQKKEIKERIRRIRDEYKTIKSLKQSKSQEHIDPMFFSFEKLPPFGKEYWFMKFTATDKDDARQLLSMFGRSVRPMKINNVLVESKKASDKTNGYMTSWFYDKQKGLVSEGKSSISIKNSKQQNQLLSNDENGVQAQVTGKFPEYTFKLIQNKKEVCNLRLLPSKNKRKLYAFYYFFRFLAGFALIDLYFNFAGTLNGKPFQGKCYVQKVVVVGPFVPWRWGRIVFENGSVLTYFLPRVELFKLKYNLLSALEFYDANTGKLHKFSGLNVKKLSGKMPTFIITGNNGEVKVTIDTYAAHEFLFSKLGKFKYVEFLGKAKNVQLTKPGIDTTKLGTGIGLVEDSIGYIL